jgi:hypothetical protein
MANTTFQKILGNLSTNPNVKNLVSDLQKLSTELKKQRSKLNSRWNQEKATALRQAHSQYKRILSLTGKSEQDLERELDKALSAIKKSAADVEKNLQYYRTKAKGEAKKLEKLLKAKSKTASSEASRTKPGRKKKAGSKKRR